MVQKGKVNKRVVNKRNPIVINMVKFNRPKVYRNRKHLLRAKEADNQIKDYYKGE